MTTGKSKRFSPPPPPSTPDKAPWEELHDLNEKLGRLVEILEQGTPGAPITPGALPPRTQLITLIEGMVPESVGNSDIIPFYKSVASAYQDEQDRQVKFNGVIRDVIMAFPSGCNQLVEVRLVYYPVGGSHAFVVPSLDGAFIALDDFTAVFQPRYLVKAPGNLRVEWWNYDSLNPHAVPVVVTLVPMTMGVKS